MGAVDKNSAWETTQRTSGEVVDRMNARELLTEMPRRPGSAPTRGCSSTTPSTVAHLQGDDRIYASNRAASCLLDDTACNLASRTCSSSR